MLLAKIKIWLIIQLVKKLEVSPRHPNRVEVLEPDILDEVLVLLRENKVNIIGYGIK